MVCSTRKQAKLLGETRYFTGKPCPNGHVAERFAAWAQCVPCVEKSRDDWYYANKERAQAKNNQWHKDNPGRKEERNKKWRLANPEKARAAIERHRLANPEKYTEHRAARRARRRNAPGAGITADDIKRLIANQGGKCVYCRCKKPLTLDHIVPLFRGGAHDPSNAQMACKPCNSSKGAKDPYEFAATRGWLF